jgi:hypothetical protein
MKNIITIVRNSPIGSTVILSANNAVEKSIADVKRLPKIQKPPNAGGGTNQVQDK